jgi:exodeoxyribonuclease VII large subunit
MADFVADVRAATPSVAGELVVPVRDDLLRDLAAREARLAHLARSRVDRAWQRVEALASRPALRDPRARATRLRVHLSHLAARLATRSPRAELERRRAAVEELASRMGLAARVRLERAKTAYEARRAHVEALSPLRVLDRGYSLTRVDGALLKSVVQARAGDRLLTEVSDGVVTSRVDAVRPSTAESAP